MPGVPHQRLATHRGDTVEKRLAGLDVGNDGCARPFLQNVLGKQKHHLVAPEDAAFAVDHAQAVAVAVESKAQVAALGADYVLQLHQVGWHCWVRVVGREVAVDGSVDHVMLAGQPLDERLHGFSGSAVTRVPSYLERLTDRRALKQDVQVAGRQPVSLLFRRAGFEVAGRRLLAQCLDVRAEEAALAEHHLESVVLRRVVRAGHHDAAIGIEFVDGEVEQRRGAAFQAQRRHPAPAQAFADAVGQIG